MNRFVLALGALGSLTLAGCQSLDNPTAWSEIASGVGAVIGETRIDPQIEKASTQLASHCTELKLAALAVDVLAPATLQQAASDGRAALASYCAAPPRNVAQAVTALAGAYAAIAAARRQT